MFSSSSAYISLMELLESLRMSSESLIAKYYQERYEEQMEEILPCKARLYVKVWVKTVFWMVWYCH